MADELTTTKAAILGVLSSLSLISIALTIAVEVKGSRKPFWNVYPVRVIFFGIFFFTLSRISDVYSQYAFLGVSRAGFEAVSTINSAIGLWLISSILVAATTDVANVRNRLKLETANRWNMDKFASLFVILYGCSSAVIILAVWPDYYRVTGLLMYLNLASNGLFLSATLPVGLLMYREFKALQAHVSEGLGGESSAGRKMRKEMQKTFVALFCLISFVVSISLGIIFDDDKRFLSSVNRHRRPED